MQTRTISFLTLLLSFLSNTIHLVESNHDGFCFGVPSPKKDLKTNAIIDSASEKKTVGYDFWSKSLDYAEWAWSAYPWEGTDELFDVDVFGIKVDGKPLNGWVHIVVKLKSGGPIERFAIVARGFTSKGIDGLPDGWVAGVGEFVEDGPKCEEDSAFYEATKEQISYKNFMSCGGVASVQPHVGGGFVYSVDPNHAVPDPKIKSVRKFHLNFRFTQNSCSFYSILQFRVTGVELKNPTKRFDWGAGASNAIYFDEKVLMGAWDPFPVVTKEIKCHEKLNNKTIYNYVSKVDVKTFKHPKCNADISCSPAYSKHAEDSKPLFTSRCTGVGCAVGNEKCRLDGSTDNPHFCMELTGLDEAAVYEKSSPKTYWEAVTEVKDLINARCSESGGGKGEIKCPTLPARPVTTTSTTTLGTSTKIPATTPVGPVNPNGTKGGTQAAKQGLEGKLYFIFDEVWDARVVHGICMGTWTTFVLPVNLLLARYYKETFMRNRILKHRIWYFYHHFFIGVSFVLIAGGMKRIVQRHSMTGTSLVTAGIVHNSTGGLGLAIFAFLSLFGGYRPMSRGLRTVFIALHWTFGWLVYVLALICLLSSHGIPGSPSAPVFHFEGMNDANLPFVYGYVLYITIARMLVDIVYHILLSVTTQDVNIWKADKKVALWRKRLYLPTPIPVLSENDVVDLPGAQLRFSLLAVYLMISTAFVVIICVLIVYQDPHEGESDKYTGLGATSCTHDRQGEYLKHFAENGGCKT